MRSSDFTTAPIAAISLAPWLFISPRNSGRVLDGGTQHPAGALDDAARTPKFKSINRLCCGPLPAEPSPHPTLPPTVGTLAELALNPLERYAYQTGAAPMAAPLRLR